MQNPPPVKSAETDRQPLFPALARKASSLPALLGMFLLGGTVMGRYLNIKEIPHYLGDTINICFEVDTWWQLVVGKRILSTGHWPSIETYSFTAHGMPWISTEWLGEILMAFFQKLGGLTALIILVAVLSGAVMLLLYYHAYQRCQSAMAAFFACALLLPLASLSFSLRPQLLGYVFLIITLICLEKFRKGHAKALWILPIVFLLWVNAHGTFVLGFLAMGVYWVSGLWQFRVASIYAERWTPKERRQLAFTFLLCLIASTLTPYGTRLAAYPLEMIVSQAAIISTNKEWLPIGFGTFEGKTLVVFLLFFLAYQVIARPAIRVEEMALLVFASYETWIHVRFVLLFVPVFAPLLAKLCSDLVPKGKTEKEQCVLNAILMGAIVAALVAFFPSKKQIQHAIATYFPASAVAYLRQHPVPAPMFNELNWGGYLTWSLTPKHQVFIDGRQDVYLDAGVLSDYHEIVQAGLRTPFLLRKYHVQSCLILRDSPLAVMLAASPKWREVYQDNLSAVFVRQSGKQSGNTTERNAKKAKATHSS